MQITSRQYNGDGDLHRLKEFLIAARANDSHSGYWHIGDVLWGMYQNTVFNPYQSIRLWEDETGKLLGFAWLEEPDGVNVQIHPSLRGKGLLEEEMLDWAAKYLLRHGIGELWTKTLDNDTRYINFLTQHGFKRDDFHYLLMHRHLNLPLPETSHTLRGFTVRHVANEDEWEERVAIHQEVWHPSKVTLDAYQKLRKAPGFLADLDLVVVGSDGTIASYCICWLDPVNKVGEFEPVGTRSAFRGKGLGKAVMEEGLRRLKSHGASAAIVASVADNRAATRLYESVGFETINKEYLYGKLL